jgi:hypothetical protein
MGLYILAISPLPDGPRRSFGSKGRGSLTSSTFPSSTTPECIICQTSGIVLAINALTPFDASTCILIPSAALCAIGQLDLSQDFNPSPEVVHRRSNAVVPTLAGIDRCVQAPGDSLLTCALNPIPLLSVSLVTLSQFFLNTLLSTINAGVLRLLIFLPTNSLTKASLDGRVRRDRGVVVCIVARWLNVSILY